MSISVSVWEEDAIPRLAPLIGELPLPAWARAYGISPDRLRVWLLEQCVEVAACSKAEAGCLLVAHVNGDPVGVATLRRIEWETRIYAVSMARIPFVLIPPAGAQRGDIQQKRSREIAAALLQAAARTLSSWGIRHASALVPAEDTGVHHAFEDAGWRLVDSTLEFAWQAGHTTAANADPRLRLRPVEERDHDALRELARNTYTTVIRTRWANDPWLPLERTGELYVQWFEEACRGAFADIVVVTELEGRPVGYNTLKRERDLSRIAGVGMAAHGIAAVDPACRGLGVQPAMLHYLTDWLGASGGEFTRGRVVISNGPMQRACLKAGGFIAQAYHSFHAWFGDP